MTIATEEVEGWVRTLIHAKNLAEYESHEYLFYRVWIRALLRVLDWRIAQQK